MITYVNCVGLLFQYRNLPMQNYLEYLSFKVLFSLSSNCLRSPPLPTITSTPILWLTYFLTHLLHIRTYQVAAAGLSTMVYTAPEQRALAWGGFGVFGGCGVGCGPPSFWWPGGGWASHILFFMPRYAVS